jgi:hypothetical protein
MSPRKRLPIASRGPASRSCPRVAALAAATLLGGCVLNSDFDRVRPELRTDGMHDWVGRDAVGQIGLPPSGFRITDDERQLRDRAYMLIAPPYDRARWYSVWNEYGMGGPLPGEPVPFDLASYWRRLNEGSRKSEVSGYAQLSTDARNDVEQLQPFFAVAGRVSDMDRKRAQSLAHVEGLLPDEEANALARNNENTAIIEWVCRALQQRAASYAFAIERLVITAPSPVALETQRSLTLLQTRIAQYCPAPPPPRGRIVKS